MAAAKKTIWSAKAASPDGLWLATARTYAWSGPAVGTAASSVCLARSTGQRECTDVISYMERAGNARPQVVWGSDDELIVRIPGSYQCRSADRKIREHKSYAESVVCERIGGYSLMRTRSL